MSATAEFGFTAWGNDIVRIAEPVTANTPNALAPRARSIARNNGVVLTVTGRQITAQVHRGATASVAHLEFAAMEPATVAALRARLGARAEPDDTTHAALRAAGGRPAPVLDAADCSCRARTTMCVHVLAALYALAAFVDHHPAAALTLQSFADGAGPGAGEVAADNSPVPRWTALAALDVRDYYHRRSPG